MKERGEEGREGVRTGSRGQNTGAKTASMQRAKGHQGPEGLAVGRFEFIKLSEQDKIKVRVRGQSESNL